MSHEGLARLLLAPLASYRKVNGGLKHLIEKNGSIKQANAFYVGSIRNCRRLLDLRRKCNDFDAYDSRRFHSGWLCGENDMLSLKKELFLEL